jgi:mannitol/fructose-specific phosphotransferase system IIA component (Ntr-type)
MYEDAVEHPWLDPSLVAPSSPAASGDEVVQIASALLSAASGVPAADLVLQFRVALAAPGFSLGSGVAIPHVEVPEIRETLVAIVTTREPVRMASIDGQPPDVFLFVLARPDPKAHLLLLARLARLVQSRTFLGGLRAARTPEEVIALVDAAEQVHSTVAKPPATSPTPPSSSDVIVVITASGEKLVDAILLTLVEHGLEHAAVLEAQSVREAATHEVPLFASFRDVFGDPGGRRVLIVDAPSTTADEVVASVRELCDAHRSEHVSVSVVPVANVWRSGARASEETRGAH